MIDVRSAVGHISRRPFTMTILVPLDLQHAPCEGSVETIISGRVSLLCSSVNILSRGMHWSNVVLLATSASTAHR